MRTNPISSDADEPVIVGRLGGAHGVRGWVRIASYTQPPENLLHYKPWFLQHSGVWQPVDLLEIRPHGDGFVARLSGIDDRDAALAAGGCRIGVPAGSFPATEPGEYYWRDLVGLEVINSDGSVLGSVERLIETGAHDVLVVGGERERMIPFVSRYVTRVVLEDGLLQVDWLDFD